MGRMMVGMKVYPRPADEFSFPLMRELAAIVGDESDHRSLDEVRAELRVRGLLPPVDARGDGRRG